MKCCAYLDIETTGLSPHSAELTVIGLHVDRGKETKTVQLFENELDSHNLMLEMRDVGVLYTYNGSRFDLPFIKAKLGLDLAKKFTHVDLMYECWQKNVYGGLKKAEKELGINRKLTDIDGLMAVQLWQSYKFYGNKKSLELLLEYNKEDVVNLKVLREKLNI